ncbi:uncharacterized protein LOC127792175 isoform X1 [Diospyros lotus]|uniref:uncharacterized protein LOC127792175 isoform X1 n=1 Tax=Diospyros lotus TaxID=55363 RepID=UPI002259BDAD|nr:uncharacterized protein LOC127792175 isoform X1 [Diospyros lotus]
MQRLRTSRSSIMGSLAVPHLKRKALNSWSSVQDTFYSTKDVFERHRVVFTVGTSVASVATAWIGYTMRHLHDSKVDQRLSSIEQAMKNNHNIEHKELEKLASSGSCSIAACVATAGTTLVIGFFILKVSPEVKRNQRYGLGWRGGNWYANRKLRKGQMKLLEQIKPKTWQLKLRRPLIRPRVSEKTAVEKSEAL